MLLTLAVNMRGYEYQELNPQIVSVAFRKPVFDKLSVDQCLQLLSRAHSLDLKPQALEKLELYVLDRIIAADEDANLGRFNEHRVRFYLESFRRRRRLSLIQI